MTFASSNRRRTHATAPGDPGSRCHLRAERRAWQPPGGCGDEKLTHRSVRREEPSEQGECDHRAHDRGRPRVRKEILHNQLVFHWRRIGRKHTAPHDSIRALMLKIIPESLPWRCTWVPPSRLSVSGLHSFRRRLRLSWLGQVASQVGRGAFETHSACAGVRPLGLVPSRRRAMSWQLGRHTCGRFRGNRVSCG